MQFFIQKMYFSVLTLVLSLSPSLLQASEFILLPPGDLIAINDSINSCDTSLQTGIINVMDNDLNQGMPLSQSLFSIQTITADPNGVIDLSSNGEVNLLSGAQYGQSYQITYRIYEIADPLNEDTAIVTVSFLDNTAPTFDVSTPQDTLLFYCETAVTLPPIITATDNCSGIDAVYLDEHRVYGSCANQYTIERRWIARDVFGNDTVSAPQIIIVSDTMAPVFDSIPGDLTLSCNDAIPQQDSLSSTDLCFTSNPNLARDYIPVDIKAILNGYDTDTGDPFGLVFQDSLVTDYINNPTPEQLASWGGITMRLTTVDGGLPSSRLAEDWGNYGMRLYNSGFILEFSDTVFVVLSGNPALGSGEKISIQVDSTGFLTTFEGTQSMYGVDFFSSPSVVTSLTDSIYSLENIGSSSVTAGTVFGARTTRLIVNQSSNPSSVARLFVGLVLESEDIHPEVVATADTTLGTCPGELTIERTWTVSDSCNNTRTHLQTITIQDIVPPSFISAPADTTLTNDLDLCSAVYNWTEPVATDDCSNTILTVSEPSGTAFSVGTNTVVYTASDQCGNEIEYSFNVTVEDVQNPSVSVSVPDFFCEGQPANWQEFISDNCAVGSVVSSHSPGTVFPPGDTEVIYTVTDASGNDSTIMFTVTVLPMPDATIINSSSSYCLNDQVEIELAESDPDYSYVWYFNGQEINTSPSFTIQSASLSDNGFYVVQVTDSLGCMSADTLALSVSPCDITIVEAFSPNADGDNDFFHIENLESFPGTNVIIYNRWGLEVYSNNNYSNDWDGTSESQYNVNGDQLPEGTYYYLVKLGGEETTSSFGNIYKGYVYLKR